MVGKILTRAHFGRTIGYNISKIDKSGERLGALDYNLRKSAMFHTNMIGTSGTYSGQMEIVAGLNDRIRKPVKHFVLAFAPEDERKVTQSLCKEMVDSYLSGMGYSNNQFCAFLHTDTDNLHIHIVCNRVRFDGTVVKDSNDKYRSREILNNFETHYGLYHTSAAKQSSYRSYQRSKQYYDGKNSELDARVVNLREQVRDVLRQHPVSFDGFKSLLSEENIELLITGNRRGLEYITGDFRCFGSRLNRLYTLSGVNAQFRKNAIYQFRSVLGEALKSAPESIESLFRELGKRGYTARLNKAGNGWSMEKDGIVLKGSELGKMSFLKIKDILDKNQQSKQLRDSLTQADNKNIAAFSSTTVNVPQLNLSGSDRDDDDEERQRRKKKRGGQDYKPTL